MDRVKDIIKTYHFCNKVIFHGFSVVGCVLVVVLLLFSPTKDGLPIRSRYPFNTTVPPWHQIGLGVETFAVSGGALAIVAMDGIAVLLCSLITMEFDMLNVNFETCSGEAPRKHIDHNANGPNTFMQRYKTCLRFHQRLVSMTADYNKAYNSSMFVQMLSSTSIICLTGFQAVVVRHDGCVRGSGLVIDSHRS